MKQLTKMPIDIVIPWVDGSDLAWQQRRSQHVSLPEHESADQRYRDFGTLKYLLRSIAQYAPWVNKIYLVTDQQRPSFIKDSKRLVVVDHTSFIPNEYLPTYNSNVIELHCWRIPGLNEHFILLNDDFLFTNPVWPSDFFTADGEKVVDMTSQFLLMPRDDFAHTAVNNMTLINREFSKREWLFTNWPAAFSLRNGVRIGLLSSLLSILPYFTRFYDHHLAIPFLKSSFMNGYSLYEREVMKMALTNKQRQVTDISVWLMRYYQILTGCVKPRSYKFGRYLEIQDVDAVKRLFRSRVKITKMVVLNDTVTTLAQETAALATMKILERRFANKSNYEK